MFKRKKKKIKVYFICQYIQGYAKVCDVVESMKKDSDIDLNILAVPDDIKKYPKNEELNFWIDKFGDSVINAITEKGWFDLEKEKPDYVFIQRPYNNYLPYQYSTDVLTRYTKLCYIPYGYSLVDLHNVCLPQSFINQLYFFFGENEYECEYVQNKMINDNHHYSKNFGYPSLDSEIMDISTETSAFSKLKSNKELKVIWTPRWTTNRDLFGTTFFEYKDNVVKYFQKNKEKKLVFRPHPLMFQNFINEKIMTKKEAKEYLSNYNEENMIYDKTSRYFNTFKDSDVLITDFSSIIIDYFILNKPIILLDKEVDRYTPIMKEINKVCYHADNWKDIEKILKKLETKDVLKTKREKIIKKLFGDYDGSTSQKIVNCIKNDFYR